MIDTDKIKPGPIIVGLSILASLSIGFIIFCIGNPSSFYRLDYFRLIILSIVPSIVILFGSVCYMFMIISLYDDSDDEHEIYSVALIFGSILAILMQVIYLFIKPNLIANKISGFKFYIFVFIALLIVYFVVFLIEIIKINTIAPSSNNNPRD